MDEGLYQKSNLPLTNHNLPLDDTMATISKQMRIEMGGASGILMSIFFNESGKIDKLNLNDLFIHS